MKQPLILATIAADRATPGLIAAMVKAGMDGIRINSAHASPDEIIHMTEMVRGIDPAQTVLVDTKGAEVRTTPLPPGSESVTLREGDSVTVVDGGADTTTARSICVTAQGICSLASQGMEVEVDDGEIALCVERVTGGAVECRVTRGGQLGSRKTVCFRGMEPDALPALTDRDRAAIDASVQAGVDIIAHSFVRTAADVEAVRAALPAGCPVQLYAKIECPQAVRNMGAVLAAADGLLCARGDLGASAGIEHVPVVEMECIRVCREAAKPLMLATQLMQSMMTSPVPTRAEAVDIAYAAVAGVDSLLLTAETARGAYPVECVEWMRRIIDATTRYNDSRRLL